MTATDQPKSVTVVLSVASSRQICRALRQVDSDQVRWAYFGETVSMARACERWLAGRAEPVVLGGLLQEVAEKVREDYIEYVGRLSMRYASESWWLTSLSEKNPYISKVFIQACRVLAAQRLVSECKPGMTILIIVEDRALQTCLDKNLRRQTGCNLLSVGSRVALIDSLRIGIAQTVAFWSRRAWFVFRHLSRVVIARATQQNPKSLRNNPGQGTPQEGQPGRILIHSWIDGRSFAADGSYQSINFGDLERYFQAQQRSYAIVPAMLPACSFWKGVRTLSRSGAPYLLPHGYLTPFDILRSAGKGFARPQAAQWPLFHDMDISSLILEDQRRDWMVGRYPTNALLGAAVRRWAKAGIAVDSFIYTFENQVWEKAYCLAFRENYPSTRLIGYHDANLPRMALNFFVSKDELPILPFPDLLITNGQYSFDLLVRSGYSPMKLRCGGALRYRYLTAPIETSRTRTTHGERLTVLVTPSMVESLACELLWKVLQAFSNDTSTHVIVKCHPGLPFGKVSKRVGVYTLPRNFQVSEQPVRELLPESTVLLYMDSTTSLEALGLGVPLIHVGSELGLDIDHLSTFPDTRRTVREPRELLRAVHDIGNAAKAAERRPELISHFFGQVSDRTYGYFLCQT